MGIPFSLMGLATPLSKLKSQGTAHIGVLKGYIAFRSKGKILRKACRCV